MASAHAKGAFWDSLHSQSKSHYPQSSFFLALSTMCAANILNHRLGSAIRGGSFHSNTFLLDRLIFILRAGKWVLREPGKNTWSGLKGMAAPWNITHNLLMMSQGIVTELAKHKVTLIRKQGPAKDQLPPTHLLHQGTIKNRYLTSMVKIIRSAIRNTA